MLGPFLKLAQLPIALDGDGPLIHAIVLHGPQVGLQKPLLVKPTEAKMTQEASGKQLQGASGVTHVDPLY